MSEPTEPTKIENRDDNLRGVLNIISKRGVEMAKLTDELAKHDLSALDLEEFYNIRKIMDDLHDRLLGMLPLNRDSK